VGGETVTERAQRLEISHDVLDFARREPKQRMLGAIPRLYAQVLLV
jgi:hypothetical protein